MTVFASNNPLAGIIHPLPPEFKPLADVSAVSHAGLHVPCILHQSSVAEAVSDE